MTDEPMDAAEHPDEGLIHAWLDDALSAAEAQRLAAHVRTCAACQARVAEARGLIAGASRIVAALDDVAPGTRPGWAQSAVSQGGAAGTGGPSSIGADPARGGSLWRLLRVTPGRAALAATILVAIGITLTYERTAVDSAPSAAKVAVNPRQSDVPATTSPEGAAGDASKPRDALLDSAVARNLAMAQGQRSVQAATGPAVPVAPPPSTTLQAPAGAAGEAVALGRAADEARRESAPVIADRAPARRDVTGATASVMPESQVGTGVTAPQAAPAASAERQRAEGAAMMAKTSANAVGKSCLLIESADADARWADQPFPLVLAIDPGTADAPRDAAVLTPAGEVTSLRAQWAPRSGDSVLVRLRRIGYSGSIVLGPFAGTRSGTAISSNVASLEETVTTAYGTQARGRADAGRAESRRAAPAAAAPAAAPPAAGPPVRQLRVTARSIGCPQP